MLFLWELRHGHDGKTTSDGLLFSFSVWKHCTIQGSSISEKPHCLKWQASQSCAAISTLLASLNWCDQPLAWNSTHLELRVHAKIVKLLSLSTFDIWWQPLEGFRKRGKRRKLITLHVIYALICICQDRHLHQASCLSNLHFEVHLRPISSPHTSSLTVLGVGVISLHSWTRPWKELLGQISLASEKYVHLHSIAQIYWLKSCKDSEAHLLVWSK